MSKSYSDKPDDQASVLTRSRTEKKTKRPNLYRVVMLNDDYTPMDFVVWVLQTIFYKTKEVSTQLMLDVHQKGRGVVGVYTYDEAQTKVVSVKAVAEKEGHPLECIMEIESG